MIELLVRNYGVFLGGALTTIGVSAAAIAIGAMLGLLLALGLISRNRLLRGASAAYRSFWRGTPILVQLLMIFYLLPRAGVDVSPLVAAVVALALNTTAFQGEIYRAGLAAIPPGQVEAARMLGIGRWRARLRIEMPQMFRLVLPALVNETISIVKNSSLVSVIAVTELMRRSQQLAAATFQSLEVYLLAGLFYLVINLTLARAGMAAERRLARAGAL